MRARPRAAGRPDRSCGPGPRRPAAAGRPSARPGGCRRRAAAAPNVSCSGPALPRSVPQALRPEKVAPFRDHDLARSEPSHDRKGLAHLLANPNLALDELAFLVLDRQVADEALAER